MGKDWVIMAEVEEDIGTTGESGMGMEGLVATACTRDFVSCPPRTQCSFCMGSVSGRWKSHGAIVWLCRSFKSSNQVSRGVGGTSHKANDHNTHT